MKKKIFTIASLFLSIYLCSALAACTKDKITFINGSDGEVESVVFTASPTIMPIDENTTMEDYLNALKEQGEIDFEGVTSQYGFYIESVNGKGNFTDQGGTHGFSWAVYTDLVELDGIIYSSQEFGTYFVDDNTTLYSAIYGVSGMPCIEGYTYALVYSEWNY